MKISYNWLKTFVEVDLPPAKVSEILTNTGLEVEGTETYESIPGGLEGLVIGQVLTCVPHPNADRLRLTTVDVGQENPLSIVCGAPNVEAGQKVVVAVVGATLYPSGGDPFKIKKSKIRGEVSEGMICAEDEIGLGASHEGIMVLDDQATIGQPANQYFDIERDTVFEIGLTPNRGDATSHLGSARDIAAVLELPVTRTSVTDFNPGTGEPVSITIKDTEACPRYSGICIKGVKVGPSPDWLKHRLQAIGIGPINNVVDATNYILHDLGQPIHAFDLNAIKGQQVIVKRAKAGAKFKTLDEVERTLTGDELMIWNAEEPMAMAGVFGGLHSGIQENTQDLFIESAYFNPAVVRKAAKYHALNTDASFRYERGTDPDITMEALKRVTSLIIEVAGGTVASAITDVYPEPIKPFSVDFHLSSLKRLAGVTMTEAQVVKILRYLDIEVLDTDGELLQVSVPAYRSDVTREADVVEELVRIYGYDHIEEPPFMKVAVSPSAETELALLRNRLGDYLAANGFHEIMTNSLTKADYYPEAVQNTSVHLLNPLSNEMNILRPDMLYSGLEAIRYNVNRKQSDLKLFEWGKTYSKTDTYEEEAHFTFLVTGLRETQNWNTPAQPADYYYLKTMVSNVLAKAGITSFDSEAGSHPDLDQVIALTLNGKPLAELGSVNKKTLKAFDLNQEVWYACLHWAPVAKKFRKKKFQLQEVSKHPAVKRDLSLLLDQTVPFSQVEHLIRQTERKLIRNISVFDVYEGKQIAAGKKSYAISLTLQDEGKTLTDQTVDKVIQRLVGRFKQELNAELR